MAVVPKISRINCPFFVIKKRLRGDYARAGIRTRVDGMKTRNDGPDYTTRAVIAPLTPCS